MILASVALDIHAHEYRNLLQQHADLATVKRALILNQGWVNYPDYKDRAGWDVLMKEVKDSLIKKGEAALHYEWKVIKATDYMEFGRSGSRNIMQDPYEANNSALADLVKAELAEGKGRFLDQIINGIWLDCEMTSWVLSAHVNRDQPENTPLPSEKPIIDLGAGGMGAFLAWTYYFFHDAIDQVNPLVAPRLKKTIQERILEPYINRSDFRWMAFNATPETQVNNWNPWCNFNVLNCFLLLENDPDKLAEAVYRTMVSVDQFINYNHDDGACEEGPAYWIHAAGRLYDYLQLLSSATGGRISLFDEPLIKNMGEYISKSFVGNGWVVNFADASAKGIRNKGLIFRYGKAVNSKEMMQFASYLVGLDTTFLAWENDIYHLLGDLQVNDELLQTKPAVSQAAVTWYPQTEFCYLRNEPGFMLATKGGYNGESHNHNDVGTFSLYYQKVPMFIDAGVGTYTRQTFSSERYSIWSMQSNYHNLPMINGVAQKDGREYRAEKVSFDPKKSIFSLDLSKAYPEEAAVEKWQRCYQLEPKGGLNISDNFNLKAIKRPNQLHFLTWGKPDISVPGVVLVNKEGIGVKMKYDARQFEAGVETIPLPDTRLSRIWGPQIYRLSLTALKMQVSGKYQLTIEAN